MSNDQMYSLKNKNILITGGAGILGQGFCRSFLSAGANLAVYDFDQKALSKLVSELQGLFPEQKVCGYQCDLSSKNSIKETFEKTIEDFQHIHVLHNNAASKSSDLKKFFAPFEEFELETWKEVMDVNINAMFLMAQKVGKHMIENGIKGSIIQTSSIYGIMAPDQSIYEGSEYMGMEINTPAVYSASKAAVVGLTQYLASYWGKKGIRVNSLVPGGMESGQNDTFKNLYSKRVPLGRMGQPKELLGALIYLASDASTYTTGQHLAVDGGLSCW